MTITKEKNRGKKYESCKKSFVVVDKSLFREYQEMAYEDLDSARKESNLRWKSTKAYQSLFLMCNSLLVKKLGYYSKDHDCLLIAIVHNNLISNEILERIKKVFESREKAFANFELKEAFFTGISDIRIARNNYLYIPKTLRNSKITAEELIKEVAELIKLLGSVE